MAIVAWKERAERARASLANLKAKAKSAVVLGRYAGESVVAAGVMGAIRGSAEASGKDYSIPLPNGKKLAPELPVGGLLLAVAMSGKADDASKDLAAMGAGVLAYSAGREAENYMRTKGTKPPGAVQ